MRRKRLRGERDKPESRENSQGYFGTPEELAAALGVFVTLCETSFPAKFSALCLSRSPINP
jgi:hypothetical protein